MNSQRVKALEGELVNVSGNIQAQLNSKDQMMGALQDQVTLWRNKYEALAKLYSQLRNEHLEMLSKYKSMQLKANSAQEAIDRMERMERDVKAKNLELADMIRERDRARFDVDRMKSVRFFFFGPQEKGGTDLRGLKSQKDELERLKRDLRFAEERADDASRSKGSEVSTLLSKYNRQLEELESSLQVRLDSHLAIQCHSDSSVSRPSRFRSTTSSTSSTRGTARRSASGRRRTRRSPSCRRAWIRPFARSRSSRTTRARRTRRSTPRSTRSFSTRRRSSTRCESSLSSWRLPKLTASLQHRLHPPGRLAEDRRRHVRARIASP